MLASEFVKFKAMIEEMNILGIAVGMIVANNSLHLVNTVIEQLVMPMLAPIFKGIIGENLTYKIGKESIQVGKVIHAFIRFMILMIIVYVLLKIGIKSKRK